MSGMSSIQKMQNWEDAARFHPKVRDMVLKTTDHQLGYAIIAMGIILIAIAAIALLNNLYGQKGITPPIFPKAFGGVGLGVTGLGFLVTLLFYIRANEARQMIYGEDSQKNLEALKGQN